MKISDATYSDASRPGVPSGRPAVLFDALFQQNRAFGRISPGAS